MLNEIKICLLLTMDNDKSPTDNFTLAVEGCVTDLWSLVNTEFHSNLYLAVSSCSSCSYTSYTFHNPQCPMGHINSVLVSNGQKIGVLKPEWM